MPRRSTVALIAGILSAAACAQKQPSPTAHVTSVPAPVRSVRNTPAVSFQSATTPVRTASPTPVDTAAAAVPRLPPDAPPRILSVAVDKTTVSSGDRVSGVVLTSSNVASVEVRVGGYGVSLNKVGVGRFNLLYTLGNLPFFVHGNFEMRIIARNPRGDATEQSLPITVR
ncbi:MAG: hypothetical protein JOY69_06895 [Candidatus Eremiobacteraeota bacterium]|nr:hypothetical protein [Candidatus Eremiobacteraeota bacterium]